MPNTIAFSKQSDTHFLQLCCPQSIAAAPSRVSHSPKIYSGQADHIQERAMAEPTMPIPNSPRQTALNVLVQRYPDHPKTRELLRDRAQNDNDEQLRDWATKQLEKLAVRDQE